MRNFEQTSPNDMDNKIIPTESEIPIDSEIETFSDYLNNNCRGILSARFGDGKSFFLNKVKQKLSNQYVFLTIYPINYQVAENKDIFEYIKRDILLQILMTSEINLLDEKYGFALRLWGFFNHKSKDIASDITSLLASSLMYIPKGTINTLMKNISEFEKHSKKINESESDKIESYLKNFAAQQGSIYEFDPISQIIYHLITDIKAHDKKQVVLIIEDMDRIDPAHIFRILNIFSAHWDIKDYSPQKLENGNPQNKYNLDKILMVCHFQNIKNIFHHLYGEKTDFTGYIHKFSPSTPYEYSLKDVLEEWILNNIPFEKDIYPDICKQLVALIMEQYDNCKDIITNIRHITDILRQSNYNIRKEYIPSDNLKNYWHTGPNYFISTYNQVTRLLYILHNFQIPIESFLDNFFNDDERRNWQLCQFVGQCWVIYPYLIKSGIKNQFTFTNYADNTIGFESSDGYSITLTCETKQEDTGSRFIKRYEIKSIQIGNILRYPDFNIWFTKQSYNTILSFFQQFIY